MHIEAAYVDLRLGLTVCSLVWVHRPHPIIRSTRCEQDADDGDEGARNEDKAGLDELVDGQSVHDSLIKEEHVELERPNEDDVRRDASTEPLSNPHIGRSLIFGHDLALLWGQGMKVCVPTTDVCSNAHDGIHNLLHKLESVKSI